MSVSHHSQLKAGNPRPGIIFSLGFEYDWKIGGYDFLEYMERPEAFNPMYHLNDEFNPKNKTKGGDFLTYMSSEEKSDGLFDNEKDRLTNTDKERYRRYERVSSDEGCPKYFGVVSFDNEFLKEHGILVDNGHGEFNLDTRKLKEIGRLGINKMISENSKFDADNVYWNAAIHTNTDNIHIHYSICEYHRKENRQITQAGNKQDCIDLKAFNALKSAMANKIIGNEHVKKLTELRDLIRTGVREHGTKEQLLELMEQLPDNVLRSSKQKCGYNSNYVKAYRDSIDKVTETVIRTNPELFELAKTFSEMSEKSQLLYKNTYGVGNHALFKNFRKNKMNDLRERCGNEVLNAVRNIYREQLLESPGISFEPKLQTADAEQNDAAALRTHPSEDWSEPPFPEVSFMPEEDDAFPEEHFPAPLPDDEYHLSAYDSEQRFHPSEGMLEDPFAAVAEQSASSEHPPEENRVGDLAEQDEKIPSSEGQQVHIKWSKEYKEACKLIFDNHSKLEDFQKAEQLLLSEAQKGNVLAVHDLGKLYSTDNLGEAEQEKSQRYYSEALKGFLAIEPRSEKLKPYLQYRIGKMYCYGSGTEQNYEEAFDWFLKSAEQGNKYAQFSLANLYNYGKGTEKDLSQAFSWYQKSALQGQPYASYAVAQMYSKGEFAAKDEQKAKIFYNDALSGFLEFERTERADDNLFYKIGMMYKKGLGTDVDIDKAIDYFKQSAQLNNQNAHYALGRIYMLDERLDLNKAEEHFLLAAEKNNLYAQYSLGKLYLKEEKKDLDKAEHFLQLAAGNEEDESGIGHYALGKLYMLDEKLDLSKAEEHFLLAAEKNNEAAYYQLGNLYMREDKLDLNKAEHFFKLCADNDNKFGQYRLGKLYMMQDKYNPDAAERYLLKAAEKNNPFAQFSLGKLYLSPDKYDWKKAEAFLTRAAEQNNQYAQVRLGMEYYKRHEFDAGQFWLKAAAAQGSDYAEQVLAQPLRLPSPKYIQNKRDTVAYVHPAFARMINEMKRHTQQLINEYEYEEQQLLIYNRSY